MQPLRLRRRFRRVSRRRSLLTKNSVAAGLVLKLWARAVDIRGAVKSPKPRSARPTAQPSSLRQRLRHDLERHRHRHRRSARGGPSRAARWRRAWRRLNANSPTLPRWLLGLLFGLGLVATAALFVPGGRAHAGHFAPGAHFDGVPLAIGHPLQVRALQINAAVQGAAAQPAFASASASASALSMRKNCRWGQPGRSPYRGSVEQALAAGGVPAEAIKLIAIQVRSGAVAERLQIGNDGIRGVTSGRVFNAKKLALSYGHTMCIDAQVNFPTGHTEPASLFEATSADGRRHAAMVPDVCGNVSVLSDAAEATETGDPANASVATRIEGEGAVGAVRGGGGGGGGDGSSADAHAVSLPSTWLNALLALGLLSWFTRRR